MVSSYSVIFSSPISDPGQKCIYFFIGFSFFQDFHVDEDEHHKIMRFPGLGLDFSNGF